MCSKELADDRYEEVGADCGIQIEPESDVLGVIIVRDPDRRGGHGDGIVESLCDLSKAESCVRYACSSGLSRIASRISAMAPSGSPFAWSAALRASCNQAWSGLARIAVRRTAMIPS